MAKGCVAYIHEGKVEVIAIRKRLPEGAIPVYIMLVTNTQKFISWWQNTVGICILGSCHQNREIWEWYCKRWVNSNVFRRLLYVPAEKPEKYSPPQLVARRKAAHKELPRGCVTYYLDGEFHIKAAGKKLPEGAIPVMATVQNHHWDNASPRMHSNLSVMDHNKKPLWKKLARRWMKEHVYNEL